MKSVFQVMSIMTLWSSSFARLVLLRPPELDTFFLTLRSSADPSTIAATDPIPEMRIGMRINLCKDVLNARRFLTEDDDASLPAVEFKIPYPADLIRDYNEMPVIIDNKPDKVNLMSCTDDPGIYISYGFTDHYYFVFAKMKGHTEIRLFAIAEPSPTISLSPQDEGLYYDLWKYTINTCLEDNQTWLAKIEKFSSMRKAEQFRLCGLTCDQWRGTTEDSKTYKISLPVNLKAEPILIVPYGSILYHTPALRCISVEQSKNQKLEFIVIPHAKDDHAVYLAEMGKTKLEDDNRTENSGDDNYTETSEDDYHTRASEADYHTETSENDNHTGPSETSAELRKTELDVDDYPMYSTELKEIKSENTAENRFLKVTYMLTKVSSLYGNGEQFQERGILLSLQNGLRNLWNKL